MNVLLAKTEHTASQFKALIKDYVGFFKDKQVHFKGIRKTYTAREGTIDDPGKRGSAAVTTTVSEKLKWFEDVVTPHIDALMSLEATNASGRAKAQLFIDDVSLGEFSSLELLRMISLVEGNDFEIMYSNIPVRTDTELWSRSEDSQYEGREVFQTEISRGIAKTTEKEQYIMADPNAERYREGVSVTPQVGVKSTIVELGDYTVQHFSGEITHRERAEILLRRTKLLTALKEALKRANEAESVPSDMTATKLFGYLHRGTLS